MIILVANCGIGMTIAETILKQKNSTEMVIVVDNTATKIDETLDCLIENPNCPIRGTPPLELY
jgi:predicted dinucleotide-utilizing enzyme